MTDVTEARTSTSQPAEQRDGRLDNTAWLDLARIVSIVAVVMIHVIAPVVTGRWASEGSAGWWTANLIDSALRWCVPVFVMISGALLLDPRRVERPRDFYLRRLARVGVPLVVWTVVYLAFRHWWLDHNLSVEDAARGVMAGTPFLQLYFLYVLVGLYALAPFLKIVIRHTTRRMQAGLAGVLIAFGALDQLASVVARAGSSTAATRFLPFAGYFVAGWLLRDMRLTPGRVRVAAAVFVSSVVATAALVGVLTTSEGWGVPGRYLYGYLSPTVVVMSLSAFVLLRAAGTAMRARRDRLGSAAVITFGIFLVHPLVLYPLREEWPLPGSPAALVLTALVHLGVTLAASVALTLVLCRIPYVRAAVG
ncbi:MAG TPA: acyltransferase family protein [Jiangellaceae bacterium]